MTELSKLFTEAAEKWWLFAPLLPAIGAISYIVYSQIKGEVEGSGLKPK